MVSPASAVLGAPPGAGGGASVPVVATLAAFAVKQNDLDVLGADTARISSSVARVEVSGVLAAIDGKKLRLYNVGVNPIALRNEDPASAAANRIVTGLASGAGGLGDAMVVPEDGSIDLEYDLTLARWVVTGLSRKDDNDFVWSFSGVVNAVQNNLIPALVKAQDVEVWGIRADVDSVPTGQSIIVSVVGGAVNEAVTIGISSLTSGFLVLPVPGLITSGARVRMTITQVGSVAPGTTLTVVAYTRPR